MSLCPESERRAAMTDGEFWAHVFPGPPEEECYWWTVSFAPDIWAVHCIRCGLFVEVDDPENRERDAFCDDCASEHVPDLEKSI